VEGERLDEPGVQVWEFQGNAVSRVRIFTDSAGFPTVITERREQELEEKEREKEEAEKEEEKDETEGKADDDQAKASADPEDKDESASDDDEDKGGEHRNGND
jgi:hypothetical protein